MKNNYLTTKNMLIFWAVVVVLGTILGGIELGLGLLVAAIISFAIIYYTLNKSWEGKIEKIKTETIARGGTHEDDHIDYHDVTYAYIKLTNGKTKKIETLKDWKVGDTIKKEKGKYGPEKVNSKK